MKSDTAITLSNVRLLLGSARFSFDGTLPAGQPAIKGKAGTAKREPNMGKSNRRITFHVRPRGR